MKRKYIKTPYAVRLYENTLDLIEEAIRDEEMTTSDFIRLAINTQLRKMINNNEPYNSITVKNTTY